MKKWTKKAEETQEATVQTAEETGVPQKSKGRRIANTIINIVLVIAIILAAVCTYTSYVSTSGNGVPSIFGLRVMSIQTESMYPTMKPGDLIFDTAVKDTSELKIGDIITYWTVIDGERVLNTHRITEIYDGGGYLIFQTKGDNNTIEDSLTVHESEIVGQYNGMKIAGLGKLFDYLQTSTGFLIVVVIPVAIFFLYHLIQFFRVLFEYQSVKNKLLYSIIMALPIRAPRSIWKRVTSAIILPSISPAKTAGSPPQSSKRSCCTTMLRIPRPARRASPSAAAPTAAM